MAPSEGQLKLLVTVSLLVLSSYQIGAVDENPTQEVPPSPPPDGGSKSHVPAEVESSQELPSETQTIAPPTENISNDSVSKPEGKTRGKSGFGGPLFPIDSQDPFPGAGDDAENTLSQPSSEDLSEKEKVEELQRLKSCRVCPPGFGVIEPCTAESDTVCAPCPPGTFSKGYSPTDACEPCGGCPPRFYQRTPCVADSDVICGPCHSHGSGFGNEDFRLQCENLTAPSTMAPTEETGGGDDDDGSGDVDTFVQEPDGGDHDDATLEPDLLEVNPSTTTKAPQSNKTKPGGPGYMGIEGPQVGQSKDKSTEVKKVKSGGFQWPILLAGIASGLVFFVIGVVTSMLCRKSAHGKRHRDFEDDLEEDSSVHTTMIRHREMDNSPSDGSSSYRGSTAASPLNPVRVIATCHGYAPTTRMSPALKQFRLYHSHELSFIDEDSDDEAVIQRLGPPPPPPLDSTPNIPRSILKRLRDSPLVARITGSPRSVQSSRRTSLRRQDSIDSVKMAATGSERSVGLLTAAQSDVDIGPPGKPT